MAEETCSMKTAFLAISAILLIPGSVFAQGQGDQDGSVAIAGSIRNVENDDFTLDGGAACVDKLKLTGTKDEDARKFCLKLADIDRRKSEHIATEASRAARRPIILSRYGSGYGNRCCNGSTQMSSEARERLAADRAKARDDRALATATAREKRMDATAEARRKRIEADNQARNQRMLEAQRARDQRMAEAARAQATRDAERDKRELERRQEQEKNNNKEEEKK